MALDDREGVGGVGWVEESVATAPVVSSPGSATDAAEPVVCTAVLRVRIAVGAVGPDVTAPPARAATAPDALAWKNGGSVSAALAGEAVAAGR